jgi:hypothetical protein
LLSKTSKYGSIFGFAGRLLEQGAKNESDHRISYDRLRRELLPMIVTVTLARSALDISKRKVIVKRLTAIHDLGATNVLCTDKTGTLTEK